MISTHFLGWGISWKGRAAAMLAIWPSSIVASVSNDRLCLLVFEVAWPGVTRPLICPTWAVTDGWSKPSTLAISDPAAGAEKQVCRTFLGTILPSTMLSNYARARTLLLPWSFHKSPVAMMQMPATDSDWGTEQDEVRMWNQFPAAYVCCSTMRSFGNRVFAAYTRIGCVR